MRISTADLPWRVSGYQNYCLWIFTGAETKTWSTFLLDIKSSQGPENLPMCVCICLLTKKGGTAECHRGVGAREGSVPVPPQCFWKVNDRWIIYRESVRGCQYHCKAKLQQRRQSRTGLKHYPCYRGSFQVRERWKKKKKKKNEALTEGKME